MTYVLIRSGNLDTELYGGRQYEDKGRRQPSGIKEWGLRRKQPCTRLDLWLLASRTMRKLIFVVKATQSEVLYCGSLRKLIQVMNPSYLTVEPEMGSLSSDIFPLQFSFRCYMSLNRNRLTDLLGLLVFHGLWYSLTKFKMPFVRSSEHL